MLHTDYMIILNGSGLIGFVSLVLPVCQAHKGEENGYYRAWAIISCSGRLNAALLGVAGSAACAVRIRYRLCH